MLKNKEYLRSILFGIEDSLVSTTGLVAGISVGSKKVEFIIFAGVIAIFVEAISMGVSEYLSDDAIKDLNKLKREVDNPKISGILMTLSYLLAGFIPILPFIITPFPYSLLFCVMLALSLLFLLGYVKGRILNIKPFKSGIKFLAIGGITTILGVLIGIFVKI